MKIAVWHNLPSGGGKRAMFYHLKGLKERGHQIEIWTTPGADNQYLDFNSIGPIHVVPFDSPGESVPMRDRFGYLGFHQDSTMRAMIAHSRLCAEQIQAGNFDVLFANSCMVYASPYIARFTTLPTLLYLGEPLRYLYEAQPQLPWCAPGAMQSWTSYAYWRMLVNDLWRQRQLRVIMREEQLNAAAFDRILVNSLFSVETCLRVYSLDAEVGYLGVDTRIFRPLGLLRQPFVICTGSFQARKDPSFIIDAISHIPASRRPALVWVSNYTDNVFEARMRQQAQQTGVDLSLRKMVSDEELVRLLNQASAFVYAPRLEPFGLAPLEANACGLPVVAVAEGGIRESIQHGQNGLLVNRDTHEMAQAIDSLLSNKTRWDEMSRKSIDIIDSQWSLTVCTDRIEQALQQTILQPKAPKP